MHCPDNVRFIIASRPSPPLPEDVPPDHPLRRLKPVRLRTSPFARHLERAAIAELNSVEASEVGADIVQAIVASGGGLTQSDLAHLTKRRPYEISKCLNGPLGRTITARLTSDTPGASPASAVYLFSHESLRELAEARYSDALTIFRDRIDSWADVYRELGWPDSTPLYLLRGYSRLLTAADDVPRLVDFVCDRARHAAMLSITGGDALAFNEVVRATKLVNELESTDLALLLRLEIEREDLVERNSKIPATLPPVWALLGQFARATALAISIYQTAKRAEALLGVIEAAQAAEGELTVELVTAAKAAASNIRYVVDRDRALTNLAIALGKGALFEESERVVQTINDPVARSAAVARLAIILGSRGEQIRTEQLLRNATAVALKAERQNRDQILSRLVLAAVACDLELAMEILAEMGDSRLTAGAIYDIAVSGAADHAEQLANQLNDPALRARAYAEMAAAAAPDTALAARLIASAYEQSKAITHSYTKATVLADLAWSIATEAEFDEAESRLLRMKRAEARPLYVRLSRLASTYGYFHHAERFVRAINYHRAYDAALRDLLVSLTLAGRVADVLRLVQESGDANSRARLISLVLLELPQSCEITDMLPLVEGITSDIARMDDADKQADAYSNIAYALASRGLIDRARVLAVEVESRARDSVDRVARDGALESLYAVMAVTGDNGRSERLASAISDDDRREAALSALCYYLISIGDYARAEQVMSARLTEDSEKLAAVSLSRALVAQGNTSGAKRVALSHLDFNDRDEVLVDLIRAATSRHDLQTAEVLVEEILSRELQVSQMLKLADAFQSEPDSSRIVNRAREVARYSGSEIALTQACARVFIDDLERRRYESAEGALHDMPASNTRDSAAVILSAQLLKHASWDSIARVATLVSDAKTQAELYRDVAAIAGRRHSQASRFEELALRAAERITDSSRRGVVHASIESLRRSRSVPDIDSDLSHEALVKGAFPRHSPGPEEADEEKHKSNQRIIQVRASVVSAVRRLIDVVTESPPLVDLREFESIARQFANSLGYSMSSLGSEAAYQLLVAAAYDCNAVARVLGASWQVSDAIHTSLVRIHAGNGSVTCVPDLIKFRSDATDRIELWSEVMILLSGRTTKRTIVTLARSAEQSVKHAQGSTRGAVAAARLASRIAVLSSSGPGPAGGHRAELLMIAHRILVGIIQGGSWKQALVGVLHVQSDALARVSDALVGS